LPRTPRPPQNGPVTLLTPDAEPLWIARYDYEPGWELPLHAHRDYFQLIMVQDGSGEALIGTSRVAIADGQLLFLRPGLHHGLKAGSSAVTRTLDTKFRVRLPALRRACLGLESVQARVDPNIVTLLEMMLGEARVHGRLTTEICQSLLTQILLRLIRREPVTSVAWTPAASQPAGEPDLCGRIERHLREHCADRIDQHSLSAALHFSYRHLHETWRVRHHTSPLKSLWIFRIERAQHMIRYSDYELKRIADLTGFASVHHFTRVFTRVVGVPPAHWRERERAGIRQDVIIAPGFVNAALTVQSASRGRTPGTRAGRR
jgi:AraC-like DNA-binding protein/quercetin dioxygenase-like cupin family protein